MLIGGSFSGQTLTWQRIHDPPGAWGLVSGDQVVAEFSWSRSEGAVRVEIDANVRRMWLKGAFPVRATLTRGSHEVPDLVYAGGTRRGLALCGDGAGFVLRYGFEPGLEGRRERRRRSRTWTAFEDTFGRTVLRAREGGRLGMGTDVSVAPDPRYRDYLSRLLSVWGGLQILMRRHRRIAIVSPFVTEASAQRGIEELEPLLSTTPGSRTSG